MIVTRSWLNEFIDLSSVSDEKLYETFNSIGLEVDNITKVQIPQGVVVGEIISCQKHPTAITLLQQQFDFVAVRDDSRTYNTKKSRPASKTAFVFIIELSYATGELIF